MAISYARMEFISRSDGKNICATAAYNSKSTIKFHGTEFQKETTFSWSDQEKPIYHDIYLPSDVDQKFKSPEILWNSVESYEKRKNSQLALTLVLALPDDAVISKEDRIFLAETFAKTHFVEKGLAVQIDIHPPEKKAKRSNFKKEKESKDQEHGDHNWHAHLLVTTRRFSKDGQEFDSHKARDLVPDVRGGRVISGSQWGKLWAEHQNLYFEEKGLLLRVDPDGIVGQKHLGPVRMRGKAFSLMHENDLLIELNKEAAANPKYILDAITATKNIFTIEDVERFLSKHVEISAISQTRELFWNQEAIIQLLEKESGTPIGKFTTQKIVDEEKQTLRLADRLQQKFANKISKEGNQVRKELSDEQQHAFTNLINGKRLSCIDGYAGAGKSHLLLALKNTYEAEGYIVRALGPDYATSKELKRKGFSYAENIYRFLFSHNKGGFQLHYGKEVWLLDEAGKLGTRPLLELLKIANANNAQLILAGSSAQLPSVDRGGVFKTLCDKYGAQVLKDVQRQSNLAERKIAQELSSGNMSQALDMISSNGGLYWLDNKDRAFEELVKKWAMDRHSFPNSTSLIIAHSNIEMRSLNEMVRLHLKQNGEIDAKEYLCRTARGNIYISLGDKIEFRGKNKELNITNGMTGSLIAINEKEITVLLDAESDERKRKISFDPKEYWNFQLAYATTNYRSQGRTVDRAYVLHSKHMNKPLFYVGLTRHVKKAYLFIDQSKTKNLTHLKQQAHKTSSRELTLTYDTEDQLRQQKLIDERSKHIELLKSSDSFVSKLSGYGLASLEVAKSQVATIIGNINDRKPDKEFFSPKIASEKNMGEIKEVDNVDLQPFIKADQEPKELSKNNSDNYVLNESKAESQQRKQQSIEALSEGSKRLLQEYYNSVDKSSALHTIVKFESDKQHVLESTSQFSEWQKSCGVRNEKAYKVLQNIPKSVLRNIVSKNAFDVLEDRAQRHETVINREDQRSAKLEDQLSDQIEKLLYKLFPDGPSRKDKRGFRFGAKGSLVVVCHGENKGSFYDHERAEGGGPFKLIQRTLGLNLEETKKWTLEFLGASKDFKLPSQFVYKGKITEKDQEWISVISDPKKPAPKIEKLSNHFGKHYTEVARYPYTDSQGNLLFYTLRLVEKADPTKKVVIPLSYGYWQGNQNNPQWSLKAYQNEKKPIYNLQEIFNRKNARVLIVEGEKTAHAATKMFKKDNIVCVTWSGGASAASKTDWSPLLGRQVIIWPDNDPAGFNASNEVCSYLRKIGIDSLHVIDKDILCKELPLKWDLADPLPEGKSANFIMDLLLSAREEGISINEILVDSNFKNREERVIHKLRNHNVVARVEERMRSSLEEKLKGRYWEIKAEILQEASRIILNKPSIEKYLKAEFNIGEGLLQSMCYQAMLYEAKTGKMPSRVVLDPILQTLVNLKDFNNPEQSFLFDFALDKSLSYILDSTVGKNQKTQMLMFKKQFQTNMNELTQFISHETSNMANSAQKSRNMQKSIE